MAADRWPTVLDCNPQTQQILGLGRAALIGRKLRDVAPGAKALIQAAKASKGDDVTAEWPLFVAGPDGSRIRTHVTVGALRKAGTQRFALRIRSTPTARSRSAFGSSMDQSYLQALFDHSPEAIVVLDQTSRILAANPKFQTLFGYDAEEALGQDIDTLIVPESLRAEALGLNRTALTGMDAEHQTLRRRKDGSVLPVSILAAPIVHDNHVVAFYSIYRDLSPLQDIAARLEQAQANLDVVSVRRRSRCSFWMSPQRLPLSPAKPWKRRDWPRRNSWATARTTCSRSSRTSSLRSARR
ncbi:PAS fold domain protein [mine drainage metagenome]|uniref:PAS fold domain protein n=1 Tax=mine drainage metagenome TaxID=410659 RepID=T1BE08_9ZZZZ